MICVQYDTSSQTGLQTWIERLSSIIQVSISIFDPQFQLILSTGETDTAEQAQTWQRLNSCQSRHPNYPNIRILPDKTAEVIDEVVENSIPVGYIVMSHFYFDANANPHIKQFRNGKPIYDEIIAKDSLTLISVGVQMSLREYVVIDSNLPQQLDDYICSHLNDKITLVTTSRALHVDTSSLRIYLQYQFHCGLTSYIKAKKFEQAKKLLAETELPLSDIATQVGTAEQQLIRLFKKQLSLTPEEYRKRTKE